eukprot:CAMPEP_0113331004 /NCGR_PEP_ID=MMETSP0010_2-20120614/22170_1 /TAXON_ID=216773 ORGANISM="Corethron hystrix, Strain 308" /NCGR_SAMPLE_ID=MMETSP0010_2 /ASSEMBLY_ACC=CAM_ASM_000155 /LENGTH=324 /DNA_ID=CAMNT_0000194067 /DNA_START=11 /DNA_END=982 /DNA_ORIENTATION=- /assembly_acc=CAM_ASM_000155
MEDKIDQKKSHKKSDMLSVLTTSTGGGSAYDLKLKVEDYQSSNGDDDDHDSTFSWASEDENSGADKELSSINSEARTMGSPSSITTEPGTSPDKFSSHIHHQYQQQHQYQYQQPQQQQQQQQQHEHYQLNQNQQLYQEQQHQQQKQQQHQQEHQHQHQHHHQQQHQEPPTELLNTYVNKGSGSRNVQSVELDGHQKTVTTDSLNGSEITFLEDDILTLNTNDGHPPSSWFGNSNKTRGSDIASPSSQQKISGACSFGRDLFFSALQCGRLKPGDSDQHSDFTAKSLITKYQLYDANGFRTDDRYIAQQKHSTDHETEDNYPGYQ